MQAPATRGRRWQCQWHRPNRCRPGFERTRPLRSHKEPFCWAAPLPQETPLSWRARPVKSVLLLWRSRAGGSYKSGVMTGSCGTHLDHAVLAVGFGEANVSANGTARVLPYIKIKNSWGASALRLPENPVALPLPVDMAEAKPHLWRGQSLALTSGGWGEHGVVTRGAGAGVVTRGAGAGAGAGGGWGEHGYIRLAAGDSFNGGKGQCGVLMAPTYPTLQ